MSNPVGRPKLEIDWEQVKFLLEAGCSGREIAANIGVSAQTLYDRCVTDNKLEFSLFSQQFQAKGESRLLAHQYQKALGLTNDGDNTLLIWLGKVRLKQKDDLHLTGSLTVNTVDYSKTETNEELTETEKKVDENDSECDNTTVQVSAEKLSNAISEGS